MTDRLLPCLAAGALLLATCCDLSQAAEPTPNPGGAILQQLRSFRQMGTVLYVAAHPDDENTLLIAYLARGRDYRTAYLSLTRGDGGQNVLGPEFGEKLGVARTQELLAARRLDGGRQFFSRAIDFGYSKDYRETTNIWDKQAVVSDIVRVYRTFRPDVVVTGFSPQPSGTHGHHTASAVLALEAFKLSGDSNACPEQLSELTPWQPKRIVVNRRVFGGEPPPGGIHMEISGNDPVLGISFNELAARSRAMHKTQGFGGFSNRGGNGPRTEAFQVLDGAPATNDIMDDVDTTWARVPGGADIGQQADALIAGFKPQDPAASVPALLALRTRLKTLASKDPVLLDKQQQLDRILQSCLGLEVKTEVPQAEVVPGERLRMHHTVRVKSDVPVRWLAVRYPVLKHEIKAGTTLDANKPSTLDAAETLPQSTPLTQPYWLREEGTPGLFRVDEPSLTGRPENPPAFPVEYVFEVEGQTLSIADEPVQAAGPGTKDAGRRLDVIPPVSLSFDSDVTLFAPGSSHAVAVTVTASRAKTSGKLSLGVPDGWQVTPVSQEFKLPLVGARARMQFSVTAPPRSTTAKLLATAEVGHARYSTERIQIRYEHIPPQLLQPPATIKALSLELATRGHKIGYLPGAGDSVDESLRQMGYTVTNLTEADLTLERLKGLDAVVIGVRAFNVRKDLEDQEPQSNQQKRNIGGEPASNNQRAVDGQTVKGQSTNNTHLAALFAYVAAGGTVVAQYNRPENSRTFKVAPYDLHVSADRVTDEHAPVSFLAPEHPVLNTPNKITHADFEGWIQERGIYYPNEWDSHFTPILASNDPGEAPLKGGLLVAQYGKGHYVYTGLVFFRQLPAGVPGAYRLFANLVSLGK